MASELDDASLDAEIESEERIRNIVRSELGYAFGLLFIAILVGLFVVRAC